jgi:hypothetical protein
MLSLGNKKPSEKIIKINLSVIILIVNIVNNFTVLLSLKAIITSPRKTFIQSGQDGRLEAPTIFLHE